MIMKIQLQKKLYGFIATAMMFSVSANAQIIYTDVNPDTSIICTGYPCSKSYNLDLNNDGTVDFTLSTNYSRCAHFQGMINRRSVNITSQSGNLAAANMLSANSTIGSNLSFSTNTIPLRSIVSGSPAPGCPGTVGSSGSWTETTDHYLGLQFSVGTNTYYGWVRLIVVVASNLATPVSCTVKDYAYNSIPNQPILAGQTCPPQVVTTAGSQQFCEGDSLLLTANYGPCGLSSLVWSTGDTTSSIVVTTAGVYSVIVVDASGNTSIDSISVAQALPVINISANIPTFYCNGDEAMLTGNYTTCNGTLLWSTGETTQSIVVNEEGTYSVTLTDNQTGYTSSDTISFSTTPPKVSILADYEPAFCGAESTILTADFQACGNASFQWSTGETTQSIVVATSNTYTVTVWDGYNHSVTASIPITLPQPIPSVEITSDGPTNFCQGNFVELFAFGNPNYQYQWSTGVTTQSLTALSSGLFVVTVTDTIGCSNLDSINVTVFPLPQPIINESGNMLCTDVYPSYQWSMNGTMINGATDQCYNATQSGYYYVDVVDQHNCQGRSNQFFHVISGITDADSENGCIVYPNPASDKIILSFFSSGKKQIQITNTLGQIVFAKEINSAKEEIDVRNFPSGIYLVGAQTSSRKVQTKFFKQ